MIDGFFRFGPVIGKLGLAQFINFFLMLRLLGKQGHCELGD